MLDPRVLELASGPNFACLATILPDGQPQAHMMWVSTDGELLLLNTEVHRRKFHNLEADPRLALAIIDRHDSYHFAEVRGRVVEMVRGPEARHHIDELSHKYLGKPFGGRVQSERVILKVAPDRQIVHD